MLTLDANFTREASKAGATRAVIVNVGGLQKFTYGARNVFGYPKSVLSVTKMRTDLDPLTCKQTLSQTTVEFADDGIVAALNAANYLIGKTLTLTVGFDLGVDAAQTASFPETSFVGAGGGVITRIERIPGIIRLVAEDARTSIFDGLRRGAATYLPNNTGSTVVEVPIQGAAVVGLKTLLDTTGIPSSFYNASSFTVANNAPIGHMVIERNVIAFGTDRRIKRPEATSDVLDKIAMILRGYMLVDENLLLGFKQYDSSATPVDRFRQADFDPATFKLTQDMPSTVTAAVIRSAYENLSSGTGDAYMFTHRDDQSGASVNWGYTGGTSQPHELHFDDESFCSFLANWSHQKIAAADTTIKVTGLVGAVGGGWNNFTGCPGASPSVNAVDASHPGYLFVTGATPAGTGVADPGEIIKFTTITDNRTTDGSWILGGLTRGMFGTTAADHLANPLDQVGSGVVIVDVTPIIWCADQILQRYPNGVPMVEVQTGMSKYGVQVADLVYADFPLYNRHGLNGLADGNTTVKFEVLKKDVDLEKGVITWTLMEAPQVARTPAASPFGQLGQKQFGVTDPSLFGVSSGSGQLVDSTLGFRTAFVSGSAPATSASLSTTIGVHRALSAAGHVVVDSLSHTFTASKDTYVDLDPHPRGLSTWRYTEVANGAAAPAVPAGCQRAYKVVTSGTAVSSVTDMRAVTPIGTAQVTPATITPEMTLSGNMLPNPHFSSFGAGLANPPDGWNVTQGTWASGTFDVVTTPLLSGSRSLHVQYAGASGTSPVLTSQAVPVVEGHIYVAGFERYATQPSIATMHIDWLDSSKNLISSSTIPETAPLVINTWEKVFNSFAAPANARYARAQILQFAAGIATDNYIDNVWMFEQATAGTVFPINPYSGQQYFRTDIGLLCYYDGTRWLTVQEYAVPLVPYGVLPNGIAATATPLLARLPDNPGGTQVYLTRWSIATNTAAPVATWTFALQADGGVIDAGFNTAADGIGVWVNRVRMINLVRTITTDKYWDVTATKAGGGNTNVASTVHCRLIVI